MAQFDRTYTTFYWSAIVKDSSMVVHIAMCCTVFELFDV